MKWERRSTLERGLKKLINTFFNKPFPHYVARWMIRSYCQAQNMQDDILALLISMICEIGSFEVRLVMLTPLVMNVSIIWRSFGSSQPFFSHFCLSASAEADLGQIMLQPNHPRRVQVRLKLSNSLYISYFFWTISYIMITEPRHKRTIGKDGFH